MSEGMDIEHQEKYVIRIESPKSRLYGWQVRLNRKGSYLSKLFSDSVHGGKKGAFKAAVEYRNDALKERGEGIETTEARVNVTLSSLPSNNSSGILGVSRSLSTESNGSHFPLWQSSWRNQEGKVKTKSYRVNKHGELNSLKWAIEARRDGIMELFVTEERDDVANGYARVIDEYEKILSYLNSLTDDDSQTLIEFLSSREIGPTAKKEMLERRLAQQMFRDRILKYWEHRCALTGASTFVIASHIKPWAISDDEDRVNPYNGLALSPNYDKAFDSGYISFDETGCILIKPDFIEQGKILGISSDAKLPKYSPFHEPFMSFHRESIYRAKTSNKSSKRDAVTGAPS